MHYTATVSTLSDALWKYFSLNDRQLPDKYQILIFREGKIVWRSRRYARKTTADQYAPIYLSRFEEYLKRNGKGWEERRRSR